MILTDRQDLPVDVAKSSDYRNGSSHNARIDLSHGVDCAATILSKAAGLTITAKA